MIVYSIVTVYEQLKKCNSNALLVFQNILAWIYIDEMFRYMNLNIV